MNYFLLLTMFSGTWMGTGKAVTNPGSANSHTRICQEIGLQLSENAKMLDWQKGYYKCSGMDADYDPTQFVINNGNLILKGNNVGTIGDNTLHITIPDPSDGTTFDVTLTLQQSLSGNAELNYLEQWHDSAGLKMQVTGVLTKQ